MVERSASPNESFNQLKSILANNQTDIYGFVDSSALPNNTGYYYRLKAIDKTGNVIYSNTVFIQGKITDLITVFPVPARNQMNIVGDRITSINIYDMNGRLHRQYQTGKTNWATINLYNLSSGTYLVETYYGDGLKTTKKVVVE